jgi:drug/metabolite transporter (DMT)-like permease
MIKEGIFAIIYIILSFYSSLIFLKIQNNILPLYIYLLISNVSTIWGMLFLKYSNLSLLEQGALIILTTRLGALISINLYSEKITLLQYIGTFIIIIGFILTLKK